MTLMFNYHDPEHLGVDRTAMNQAVLAAGFRLQEAGNFLRNPHDPRDKNTPDPPQPKDEFVPKFVKR